MFVHVPEDLEMLESKHKVYVPSTKQVPDAEVTGERWVKCSVKMDCIGEIEVMSIDPDVQLVYEMKGHQFLLDKFVWKWVWRKDSI